MDGIVDRQKRPDCSHRCNICIKIKSKKIHTAVITYSGDLEYQNMCMIFNVEHTLQVTHALDIHLSFADANAKLDLELGS